MKINQVLDHSMTQIKSVANYLRAPKYTGWSSAFLIIGLLVTNIFVYKDDIYEISNDLEKSINFLQEDIEIQRGLLELSPLPSATRLSRYRFDTIAGKFANVVDLKRASEISKSELEEVILSTVPKNMKENAKVFIPVALESAEKLRLDPFWVLAIMWTESHFNPKAKSWVGARGPMQIMPKTGAYLSRFVLRKYNIDLTSFKNDPFANIRLGSFYLKVLLRVHKYDHKYATVAYNMGQGWVKKRLKNNRPVGVRNRYLNKVRRSYRYLTRGYKKYFSTLPYPYEYTLAAKSPITETAYEKKLFNFLEVPKRLAKNKIENKKLKLPVFL